MARTAHTALLADLGRLAAMALTDDGDVRAVLETLVRGADPETAAVLRAQAAAAVEARAARAAARLDPLTGVLNHGAMHVALREEIARAARRPAPLSCLMLDVDRFKAVNDDLGHATGDEVLRGVAQALIAGSRPYDRVCRYGGDEFVLLLPGAGFAAAEVAAERIRADVPRAVEALAGVPLGIAASVGLAEWREGETPAELLDAADYALLEAKRQGRDVARGRVRRFSRY